jgi:glycogen(starch) synthase
MKTGNRPTRILFVSYAFHPSIGGVEATSRFLVEHLVRRGLDITVVTQSQAIPGSEEDYGYPVIRRPNRGELLRLVCQSDLIFQNNISLNYLWPLLIAPRPLIIVNHTPVDATIEKSALKRQLKFFVMRFASTVSVSQFLADMFPVPSRVIYNALRGDIFHLDRSVERNEELLFVGRLVDAKGVDTLLYALHRLGFKGIHPKLTIAGGGGEEQKLKALTSKLELDGQVGFIGPQQPTEIARLMNQHQILVVPSRRKPAEALGIVAMEGIACGAVPVVAAQGGLPEAIGPCGLTFECENPQALADTLECVLGDAELRGNLRRSAAGFLRAFDEETIVSQYLEVLAKAMPEGRLTYRV